MADRISFMAFIGFPDPFPDSRTTWLFKQRIDEAEKDKVWAELQRQLDAMGLQVSLTSSVRVSTKSRHQARNDSRRNIDRGRS